MFYVCTHSFVKKLIFFVAVQTYLKRFYRKGLI
jgi:hypothetical protein